MLLSFASPAKGEAAGEIARAIGVELPTLAIFSFIDLSALPRPMRGFVKREFVKRQESAVRATRAAFVRAGRIAHNLAAPVGRFGWPDQSDLRIANVCGGEGSGRKGGRLPVAAVTLPT